MLALHDSLGISMERKRNVSAQVSQKGLWQHVFSSSCVRKGSPVVNWWRVMKRQMKLVFEWMKERRLGKITPIEEGDITEVKDQRWCLQRHHREMSLLAAENPAKKEARSRRGVNQTPCVESVQEGVEGADWSGVNMRLSRAVVALGTRKGAKRRQLVLGYHNQILLGVRKCDSRDWLLNQDFLA